MVIYYHTSTVPEIAVNEPKPTVGQPLPLLPGQRTALAALLVVPAPDNAADAWHLRRLKRIAFERLYGVWTVDGERRHLSLDSNRAAELAAILLPLDESAGRHESSGQFVWDRPLYDDLSLDLTAAVAEHDLPELATHTGMGIRSYSGSAVFGWTREEVRRAAVRAGGMAAQMSAPDRIDVPGNRAALVRAVRKLQPS